MEMEMRNGIGMRMRNGMNESECVTKNETKNEVLIEV